MEVCMLNTAAGKRPRIDFNEKKFIARAALVVFLGIACIVNKDWLINVLEWAIIWKIRVYHILWAALMFELIVAFVPKWNKYICCGKIFKRHYRENEGYDREKVRQYTLSSNKAALIVLFVWMAILGIVAYLYFTRVIGKIHVFAITAAAYLCDTICVNIWCPFRVFIVKNKCCNSCRIYNWGQCMLYSALILIPSFWTYSLLAVALAMLVQWEIQHALYPERFSEISNLNLRCANCVDKCKTRFRNCEKTPRAISAGR